MSQEDHNQSHVLRNAAAAGGTFLAILGLLTAVVNNIDSLKELWSPKPEVVSNPGNSPSGPEPGPDKTDPGNPPAEPEPNPTSEVTMPNAITSVYVFYQDKSLQSADGCVRESSAQGVPPSVFKAGIDDFIGNAQEQNKSLIITALNPTKNVEWDGAEDISINGKNLTPQVTYWCNDSGPSPGFEYPI
jgi:hypothetical protein